MFDNRQQRHMIEIAIRQRKRPGDINLEKLRARNFFRDFLVIQPYPGSSPRNQPLEEEGIHSATDITYSAVGRNVSLGGAVAHGGDPAVEPGVVLFAQGMIISVHDR